MWQGLQDPEAAAEPPAGARGEQGQDPGAQQANPDSHADERGAGPERHPQGPEAPTTTALGHR